MKEDAKTIYHILEYVGMAEQEKQNKPMEAPGKANASSMFESGSDRMPGNYAGGYAGQGAHGLPSPIGRMTLEQRNMASIAAKERGDEFYEDM